MRLVRFRHEGRERLGRLVESGGESRILDLNAADDTRPLDLLLPLKAGASVPERAREAPAGTGPLDPEAVTFLPPIARPGKILCLGHNYRGHLGLGRTETPESPTVFCKTVNTPTGHGRPIVIPRMTDQVDFEAELGVVIGRGGREIPESAAMEHVAGYTICNDVSARDVQKRTSQWMLGKSFDTFLPMGPALVTPDEIPDVYGLELSLTLNGVERQRINTREMIFSIAFLIATLSAVMTLEPGDLILTGTPAKLPASPETPAFMRPGDVVEIRIDGLGILRNPVVAADRKE
jgi:2-keto-4-pentenoate hydratase/2-oxohepta-3-ene-1,7-dioic acid hydratase in catechol pathway